MKKQNNPFNIRRGRSRWLGSISSTDDKFEQFDTLEHGVRAFFIIMRTYALKYNIRTIRGIVTRFAPPSDNNPTEEYIKFVCRRIGHLPDDELKTKYDYIALAVAMADFETGTFILYKTPFHVWDYYHIEKNGFPELHS